jgi:hypothetical protein
MRTASHRGGWSTLHRIPKVREAGACAWVEFVSILPCTATTLLTANLRYFLDYCAAQLQNLRRVVLSRFVRCIQQPHPTGYISRHRWREPQHPIRTLGVSTPELFFSSLASLKFSLRAAACTVDPRISKIETSPEQAKPQQSYEQQNTFERRTNSGLRIC